MSSSSSQSPFTIAGSTLFTQRSRHYLAGRGTGLMNLAFNFCATFSHLFFYPNFSSSLLI